MTKGDENFKWWWAVGTTEPETYSGPCDTREQAIAEAQAEEGDNYGFVIVEADRAIPSCKIFQADRVFEEYTEHNIECWGEDGADVEATAEQEIDLEVMLAATFDAWFKKHGISQRGWAFYTQRNQETFAAAKEMTQG